MTNDVVRFNLMPACASSPCLNVALDCTKLATSCSPTQTAISAPDAKPTSTATPLEDGCYTYYRSCYCALSPSPLLCALPCRTSAIGWMEFEDWANMTCPTDPLPLGGVPACARQCIFDGLFAYGCVSRSPLCFCALEALFGCAKFCSAGDNSTLATWYSGVCRVNESTAENRMRVVNKTQLVIKESKAGVKFTWYEIVVLATLTTSVALFVLHALVLREPLRKKKLIRLKSN